MTPSQRAIEAAARAIYESRNGSGCKPWSLQTKAHKEPYLDDAKAALTAALAVDGVALNLAKFLAWAMKEGPFDGCDLDGSSVQDKAEELGLIIKTTYDPARHGERLEAWEGCNWFEVEPGITALLAAASEGEKRK